MPTGNMKNVFVLWTILITVERLLQLTDGALPVYMWPLDAQYGNAEVINGAVQNQSACTAGNTGISTGHPDLDYNAVQFYGTADSYMDLTLPINTIHTNIALTVFLHVTQPLSGTIFHYKTQVTSDMELYLQEILMYANATYLTVNFVGENSVDYGTVSIPQIEAKKAALNAQSDWIPIAVVHDHGSGEIQIIIDTFTLAKVDNGFTSKVFFAQPGVLRLGDRQRTPNDPFKGTITCVQLYDSKFTDLAVALDECKPVNWQIVPTTAAPPSSCIGYTGYFVLSGRDKIPDQMHATHLMTSTVTSSRQCGDLCLRTSGCVSFASNKGNNSCHLYSRDYAACLQSEVGTNYYVKKLVDC